MDQNGYISAAEVNTLFLLVLTNMITLLCLTWIRMDIFLLLSSIT
uniref:Similar to CALM1 protein n=1 Tax=Arundo donax TaxID=35708 RepID=A0A0A9GVU3_ARUDO